MIETGLQLGVEICKGVGDDLDLGEKLEWEWGWGWGGGCVSDLLVMEMKGGVEAGIGAGEGVELKWDISYWDGLGGRIWIGAEEEPGDGVEYHGRHWAKQVLSPCP